MRLVHYEGTLTLVQVKQGDVFFSYNTPIGIELYFTDGEEDAHILFLADRVVNPSTNTYSNCTQRHLKKLASSFSRHKIVPHSEVLRLVDKYFPSV